MGDRTITHAQHKRLLRLVGGLNTLLREVQQDHPDAEWYLCSNSLCLMSGPSHEGTGISRPDRVMVSTTLRHSGGGDF